MSLNGGPSVSTLSIFTDISGESVTTFNVYLPNGTDGNTGDTLNFGLASYTDNVNDTTPGNITGADNALGVNDVNISGPNGGDTTDTVNLDTTNLGYNGSLNVSAGTINIPAGDQVSADTMSLTSANSMTFATTGMPYLGAVTVNAAPPTGLPFAGDQSITATDWGALGYVPGGSIEFATPAGATATVYTVAGVVGDNMYLDPGSPIAPGSYPNASVGAGSFTPQIAAYNLTLAVSQSTSTITGAINTIFDGHYEGTGPLAANGKPLIAYGILNAKTQGGNISIQDLPNLGDVSTPTSATLELGTLNAGTGTIQLNVNGSITHAQYPGGLNLTAGAADLTASSLALPFSASGNYSQSSSGDEIAEIADVSDFYVGQPVEVVYQAFSGISFSSTVASVSVSGDYITLTGADLFGPSYSIYQFFGGSGVNVLGVIPNPIGSSDDPITTEVGQLTAATATGGVYIQNSGPAALTINSVVADQYGQAPTVTNGQILYENNAQYYNQSNFTPSYTPGNSNVSITSTGPIVLNSVTATGNVTISGTYILDGNAKSQTVEAQQVDLSATGTADYHGEVIIADNASGDTITTAPVFAGAVHFVQGTNGANDTITNTQGWAGFQAGDGITISGASSSSNDAPSPSRPSPATPSR